MTLSFSQQWPKSMPKHMAGQNTLFPLKVLKCLEQEHSAALHAFKMRTFFSYTRFKGFDSPEAKLIKPKLHTIREDKSDSWKAGRPIHFVINNRSKNRYQFAPQIETVSVQKIEIKYIPLSIPADESRPFVKIDGKLIFGIDGYDDGRMTELAINDGFNSKEDFFAWFKEDFTGKIIHWTDLRYGHDEKCLMECTSCDKEFDIEIMTTDADDNWFCKECFEELAPVMKAEYDELVERGEIERE